MFTRLRVWWFFYCFRKGIKTHPKMVELKKKMDMCEKSNKEM